MNSKGALGPERFKYLEGSAEFSMSLHLILLKVQIRSFATEYFDSILKLRGHVESK